MRSRITLTFDRAKTLLLMSGLILIGVVGLVALTRGVDPVEVAGTLLFVPVFAGFLFFGVPGGIVLGDGGRSRLHHLALAGRPSWSGWARWRAR